MKETERDREFHGEITSTSARSEIFKPSHSHITNNSIYCRCKLIWREGGTEGEREGGRGEREREGEREDHGGVTPTGGSQSEIFIPSHSHITNSSIYCRCKLTWSPMYCTNRIGPTEILMASHNRQDQH